MPDTPEKEAPELEEAFPLSRLKDTKKVELPKMLPVTLTNQSVYNINKSAF